MNATAGRSDYLARRITPASVLGALRYGAENGVPVAKLANMLTGRFRPADQRQVRHVIEALRSQGYRICAHPATGYYLAQDAADLDATCEFLYQRALTSLRQISAMKRVSLPDLRGQLQLPPIAAEDDGNDR